MGLFLVVHGRTMCMVARAVEWAVRIRMKLKAYKTIHSGGLCGVS
jgi:hypothetical protein